MRALKWSDIVVSTGWETFIQLLKLMCLEPFRNVLAKLEEHVPQIIWNKICLLITSLV
jgi:hypothetical protein